MDSDWIDAELAMRLELLNSASTSSTDLNIDFESRDISPILSQVYQNNAYDTGNLNILHISQKPMRLPVFLSPPSNNDCAKSIQLSEALVSMGRDLGVYVFKNLLYSSDKQERFERSVENYFADLKKQGIFKWIFTTSEARRRMQAAIAGIKEYDSNIEQAQYKILALTYNIALGRYNEALLSASNDSIYKMLRYESEVIKVLSSSPELCVGYFLGELTPISYQGNMKNEWLHNDLSIKREIIDSPKSELLPAGDIADVLNLVTDTFMKLGYDPQDLDKLLEVRNIAPVEGCRIAMEFNNTLLSMEADQAAYVFKNLLYSARRSH
jgi:hypothetical protein